MRLHTRLPKVEPRNWEEPTRYVSAGCQGRKFRLHQPVKKPLRDPMGTEVHV